MVSYAWTSWIWRFVELSGSSWYKIEVGHVIKPLYPYLCILRHIDLHRYIFLYTFVSKVWFEHVKINKFFWVQIGNYEKTNKSTYSILNLAYKAEKIITKLDAL